MSTQRSLLPQSLRFRIIALSLLIGSILSFVGVYVIYTNNHTLLEKASLARASAVAESVALAAESTRSSTALQRFITTTAAHPEIKLVVLVTGEPPQVVGSSRIEWVGRPLTELPSHHVAEDLEISLFEQRAHHGVHHDTNQFAVTLPTSFFDSEHPEQGAAPGAVLVHVDHRPIQASLEASALTTGALLVSVVLLLTLATVTLTSQLVVRRVETLRQSMLSRQGGHNHEPLLVDNHDEIGDLISAFNDLNQAIDQRDTSLRQAAAENRLLANAVGRADNAFIVCDATGHIEWCNAAFTRITGYEQDEVQGRKPGDFLQGPDTDPKEVGRIRQAIRSGEGVTADLINYHKNGSPYWIHIEIQPLYDDHGQVTHFMAVESDITQQQTYQKQLIQAKEEAEHSARAKAEFLATMSHEIRTPMNGVIGMTELLMNTQLGDEQLEYASTIKTCGSALLELINDILDFSKIDAGELNLEAVPFDIQTLVSEIVTITKDRAHNKGLEYGWRIADGVPTHFIGDPTRLRQILINLTSNALKFTERGSVKIQVSGTPMDQGRFELVLAVKDSGIGIPPDVIPTLFSAFTQADSSTTRRFGGTGLGLAISQRISEAMGGCIQVTSSPGQGSTFTVTLPLTKAKDIAHDAMSHAELSANAAFLSDVSELKGLRVLLAEDNVVNQRLATAQLMRLGCEIDLAHNGNEAIERFTTQPPQIILMDCQMPELDGFQASLRIRDLEQSNHYKRTPIIALTANALDGDRERCLNAGMDDYLTKPVSIDALRTRLTEWASKLAAQEGTQSA